MKVAILALLAAISRLALAGGQPPAERAPLQIGFEQRVRNENWNNLFDMSGAADDQRNQIRYRTRIWADLPLPAEIDFHIGLAQETNQKIGKDNAFDEVFFETAYLDFRRLWSDRVSLRVGRQNLLKGDGFLFSEGGPLDGSRALYFNGFDLSYSAKRTRVELIGIFDPKRDRFLPRINDQHRLLVDWDEQALGMYLTRDLGKAATVEGYYFLKREFNDYRASSNPAYQPDRRFHLAGGRTVRKLTPSLSVAGEFAVERGWQRGGTPLRAWAGYGYARRSFASRFSPWVKAGYWAWSGGSQPGRIGDWAPLFSRGATFGDLNLYSDNCEKGIGYVTNTKMAQAEAGFSPSKRLAYRFTYEHLSAFHPVSSAKLFGPGLARGENLQARADFTLNDSVRGHVDFETLFPGSFYAGRDRAWFLRFECIYQFKTRLGRQTARP